MTQSAAEVVKTIAESVAVVKFNFDRALSISANLDLNSEDIDAMPRHIEFLLVHLKTIEAHIADARNCAERVAQMIKQPAAVS